MIVGAAISIHNFLLWVGELVGFLILVYFFVGIKRFGPNRRSVLAIINAGLDARAARVNAQLRVAEESRAEARRAHEDAQMEIAQAHEEALRIVERAQNMRGALREELTAAADHERDRIIAQARDEIGAEGNRAVLALRQGAADLVIEAAGEVLRRTMDEPTDRAVIVRALTLPANQGPTDGDS